MATDARPKELSPLQSSPLNKTKSTFERLVDSFLQESSIKWMLVIGAAIISASSLMLVTRQWSSLPVTLKYLTILGYTAATFATAEYCGRRMKLHATAEALRFLTLVLIPIGFLSLAWLTDDALTVSNTAMTLLLLIPATGFMMFAVDRIFTYWLHGRQHTFVVSYMLLCLAGALPVIHSTWLAVLFSSGFWLVMTIGVVKVNRHVFWLTEEHRLPRVFGFLPIAMLSSLFLVLIVQKTFTAVPTHWLGLGMVMLASTILLTTKTIADVFRQRTGSLVHPLPWPIVCPLLVGLVVTVTGVLFSFHGFSFTGSATRAVVPTAIIAAGLMMTIGRDMRNRGFVWAGLILLTIAYQSCPTLFGDLLQTLKSGAASAINESRLPIAFYGLTYMPLLVGSATASRWFGRRQFTEFQLPLKQFVIGMSLLLMLLSLTNLKAVFLVSAISTLALLFHSVMFRDRRILLLAIGSLILAVASAPLFAAAMELCVGDLRYTLVSLSVLGLVLSHLPGLDRFLQSPMFEQRVPVRWFAITGETISLLISATWMAMLLPRAESRVHSLLDALDWTIVGLISASLCLFTIRSRNYLSSLWMWLIGLVTVALYVGENVPDFTAVCSMLAIGSGVIMLATYAMLRAYGVDISTRRFLTYSQSDGLFQCPTVMSAVWQPLADLTLAVFALFTVFFYLPSLLWATITLDVSVLPIGWAWVSAIIAVGAIMHRSVLATATALFFTPLVTGLTIGCLLPQWFHYEALIFVYAISSAVILSAAVNLVRKMQSLTVWIGSLWLAVIAPLGLLYLSPLVMASSAIAILMMLMVHRRYVSDLFKHRTSLAMLASVQAIQAASMIAGFRGSVLSLPSSPLLHSACVWMLSITVLAVIVFEYGDQRFKVEMSRRWSMVLRGFVCLFFVVCLAADGFLLHERIVIIASMLVAGFVECHTAVRRQVGEHVFGAYVVFGLVISWFYCHQAIPVPHSLIRLFGISAAGLLLLLAHRFHGRPGLNILVPGATTGALALPAIITVWSLIESAHGPVELLIVFAAAATWFVYGRMHHSSIFVVGAAMLLNVGFFTLFAAWSLTDPQMYLIPAGLTVIGLVELLRVDIPKSAHDPLRYIGALAILVSPCFQILGGSWLHLVALMVLSVIVILIAIGLRLRALIHVGAAFLLVDLVAMVVRSTIDHPGMLWVTGLAIGASVIAIAAMCEHYRESLLSRIRILSDELSTWQ
jgi:hypothetical protein